MADPKSIKDLSFDPKNARVRTAKGSAMIQDSLGQVGAARSIVIDENNVILAGNGTVEAAGQVGIERVRVIDASGDEIIAVRRRGLTDEQKKKLAYYDNRTADEAEWDMEQVARDLLEGFDFLDDLFEEVPVPQPETKGGDELPDDPAEVLREKWGVEYGDLWQIGPHRILCGDSTKKEDVERLLDGATPNLMVTDPPYGVDYEGGEVNKKKRKKIAGDSDTSTITAFLEIAAAVMGDGAWYVWHADTKAAPVYNSFIASKFDPRALIIWHKINTGYGAPSAHYCQKHEPCLYGVRGSAFFVGPSNENTVWEMEPPRASRYHPTEKPLECMQRPIRNHKGDVYDPFVGSGTTLVAAHNEGRTCYAMEIDPGYVAVCLERMAQLGYTPTRSEGVKTDTPVQ